MHCSEEIGGQAFLIVVIGENGRREDGDGRSEDGKLMDFKLIHLGGENTVTGSCHLLQANGINIMVDCGLAQGNDVLLPMKSWPVSPSEIDYLFLTHAHIDHIGRVPELIERGFSGEIICSHPTKALLSPMLEDAMGFSDMTEQQAAKILKTIDDLSWGFEYRETFSLKKGIKFRLGCAGHILGMFFPGIWGLRIRRFSVIPISLIPAIC